MALILERPWKNQPRSKASFRFTDLDGGYVLGSGFYNARTGLTFGVTNGAATVENGAQVLRANSSGVGVVATGVVTANPSILMVVSTTGTTIDSTVGPALVGTTSAYTTVTAACGPATGLLTNEVVTILPTGGARYGVTTGGYTIVNGLHTLLFHWTGSTYQLFVDDLEVAVTSGGAGTSWSAGDFAWFGGRTGAAGAYANPVALISASRTDLREFRYNPWRLFGPRRIIIPAAAASGVPTLSASTYVAGSLTSTGWRPQVTAS